MGNVLIAFQFFVEKNLPEHYSMGIEEKLGPETSRYIPSIFLHF